MITKILWMVIYLAVGYLAAVVTETEEDTPGTVMAVIALWPLGVTAWFSLHIWTAAACAIDWLLIKLGYEVD